MLWLFSKIHRSILDTQFKSALRSIQPTDTSKWPKQMPRTGWLLLTSMSQTTCITAQALMFGTQLTILSNWLFLPCAGAKVTLEISVEPQACNKSLDINVTRSCWVQHYPMLFKLGQTLQAELSGAIFWYTAPLYCHCNSSTSFHIHLAISVQGREWKTNRSISRRTAARYSPLDFRD